ncbi:uncharacterized protein LOC110443900 [Mizuhopecten yessoensis]|uniref:Cyclic nucleotide-binding domain-containing protein 2 n=1 Tax=Mizuhopecten yessoensis TaxID=6573 RepID=A0A210PDT5_MIZYE|nr:uncharacterized protein LOC110443900 [Mizuhopecten yessoensis]OWF34659.1 Cyclic nucleotide-binding domain-containing protein 2 [Mizuhopecten yessoensis]
MSQILAQSPIAHGRLLQPLPAVREQSKLSDVPSLKKISNRKKSRTRRDSMISLLRQDLGDIESLPAVRKYRYSLDSAMDDNRSEVFSSFSNLSTSRVHRRRSSLFDKPVRRRQLSTNSDSSGEIQVTEYEMKKIAMLQSLNAMGGKLPNRNMNRQMSVSEVAMYEDLALKKKTSLTTRILGITTNRCKRPRRQSQSKDRASLSTPVKTPEPSHESKDKMKQIVDIMRKKSSSSPVPVPGQTKRPSLGGSEPGTEVLNSFRRKLIRKRKRKPYQRFRNLARFLVVLLRAWRIHSQSVGEMLGQFGTLDAMTNSAGASNLLFDITDYKASKQASVSNETRRILMKRPKERTDDEIHYLQTALRNYKSIAEYPVRMQKLIAQRGWLESYDSKRVIVREGHIARGFYFILTGAAVVSMLDTKTKQAKTVLFLNRGDSFGEQAIMTQSLRQTTVISREKIELLVMGDTDFVDIFMSGGLRDPNDPFLRDIPFLADWPIEKLAQHPKKAILSYFKRGAILVPDSKDSEWLFVIKSGSCSIFKKLEHVNPKKFRKPTREIGHREKLVTAAKNDHVISHEDQITLLREDEIKRLEQKNLYFRFYALPEINIATNAAYQELRKLHYEHINQNHVTRALGNLGAMSLHGGETESIITEAESKYREQAQVEVKNFRKKSIANLHNLVAKGPFLKPKQLPSDDGYRPLSTTTYGDDFETELDRRRKQVTIRSDTPESMPPAPQEDPPTFIEVRILQKGMSFGIEELVFDNQPGFSLVSNGVEVMMMNKKFFQEYLNNDMLVRLKEKTFPYPSDDDLQKSLELQLSWNYHKEAEVNNTLRSIKLKRSTPGDARAILEIPAEIK